jgi:hypothetical protein
MAADTWFGRAKTSDFGVPYPIRRRTKPYFDWKRENSSTEEKMNYQKSTSIQVYLERPLIQRRILAKLIIQWDEKE